MAISKVKENFYQSADHEALPFNENSEIILSSTTLHGYVRSFLTSIIIIIIIIIIIMD